MKSKYQQKRAVNLSGGSSDIDIDCSCEILLDTSLSQVGDTQCSCSECLEANLNAYNELKEEEKSTVYRQKIPVLRTQTVQNRRTTNLIPKNSYQQNQNFEDEKYRKQRLKTNKLSIDQSNIRSNYMNRPKLIQQKQQKNRGQFSQMKNDNEQFNQQEYNDYILITKNRTREYMEKNKRIQNTKKEEKNILKNKIKENLQLLKYTSKIMREQAQKNGVESKQKESKSPLKRQQDKSEPNMFHKYSWGHKPYDNEYQFKHCCHLGDPQHLKPALNTNLEKFNPNFNVNRDQILNELKKNRNNNQKIEECPDQCPNHHLRTPAAKIKQIQAFIVKQAKLYQEKIKKKQNQKQEKQKIKKAKLRAIQLKCKQKVQNCQKYDPKKSKTNFHSSVEHFSTFSDIRMNQEKKQKLGTKNKNKNNKGDRNQFQGERHKYIEDNQEQQQFKVNRKQKETKKVNKIEFEEQKQEISKECKRISQDAGIKAPKRIKKQDQGHKMKKKISMKNIKEVELKKQQQKKKKIMIEVNKKKEQLLQQYHKKKNYQGTKQPKNKAVRQEYQQKMKSTQIKQQYKGYQKKGMMKTDPYRNVYSTKAEKNVRQIAAHGDPLIQEHDYHIKKSEMFEPQEDLYTQNYIKLAKKSQLQI